MEYDPVKGKFRASLRWLYSLVHQADGNVLDTPEKTVTVEHPFVIVQQCVQVRQEIVNDLTQGGLYCTACHAVFTSQLERKPTDVSEVIQNLARRGFYVSVGDEEVEVDEDVLCQRNPFSEVSHVALIDALMTAQMTKIVSIEHVVHTVKKYGSFNASKELPFDLEDALLLWVNKVCHFAVKQHIESLQSNDATTSSARCRRRLRAKVGHLQVPFMDDLGRDLRDGRCLGVLTSFFLPDLLDIQALKLSDDLTQDNMKGNVQLVKIALDKKFVAFPLAVPLSVEDVVESSLVLKQNIVSLVVQLFDWFEAKQISKGLERPLIQTHGQLTDKSSGHSLVATDVPENQSLDSNTIVTHTRHSHVQKRFTGVEKPPLPKCRQPEGKREKQSFQECLVEQVSEKTVNNGSHGIVIHGVSQGVQSNFEGKELKVHPAHWRHVPLKRGRWMSKSLDSFQKDLPVRIEGLTISNNTDSKYSGPETCLTAGKQEDVVADLVASSMQSSNLNETFSCNHESEIVDDQNTNDFAIFEGSEETKMVQNEVENKTENRVELYANDVSTAVESDALVVSDMTVGDNVRCKSSIHHEPDQKHSVVDKKIADIDEVLDDEIVVSQQLVVETNKHETVLTKGQCVEPLEGQIANPHTEQNERDIDNESSKLSPELLVLRLKLEEKRRTIEQERLQLEAQWEEHKRRVSEVALLEALRRAKTATSTPTRKPSLVLSSGQSVVQRNKWLENGEGGVGRKQQTVAETVSSQSCHEKVVPVRVPVTSAADNEEMALRQGTGGTDLFMASTAAGIADEHIVTSRDHENHASPILSERKRLEEKYDTGETISLNQSSSQLTSTVLQSGGHHPSLQLQPEESLDKGAGIDKSVGFFVGGWGNEDNKISSDELERRKARLLQSRQKQLDVEREKRQAEVEKRKQRASMKCAEQERLRKQKEEEQARIRDEQEAKELAQIEILSLAQKRQKTRLVHSTQPKRAGRANEFDSANQQESRMLGQTMVIGSESGAENSSKTGVEAALSSPVSDAVSWQSKIPTRSNRQLIQNAVSHVCLAGDVNSHLKDKVLEVLDESEAAHFLILFRDGSGKKFRALYAYEPDTNQLHRLCGKGPRLVDSKMIAELYKYNSGSKSFQVIQSTTLSLSVDAFTIDSQLWQTKRGKSARKL